MKVYAYYLIVALLGTALFVGCSDDKDDGPDGPSTDSENKKANTWIQKTMKDHYLWYDEIPDKEDLDLELDPKDIFENMLSDKDGKTDDKGNHLYYFSYIEKKREDTKASSDLDPSYGFQYIVYPVTNQQNNFLGYYYGRVLYVLPGSPAEEAGLKRDDWIYGVDGKENNITDYIAQLSSGNESVFKVGFYNPETQRLEDKPDITMPAARLVENNPFLKDSVYQIEGKKIGYLVYNHFSSQAEGKTDKAYDNQMKAIFADFKAQGVNEFVLDLRFNGGGLVSCATLLASYLAPASALGKTFSKMTYNGKQANNETIIPFSKTVAAENLDLNRLWVLTGQFTASSSEAVINGLKPYMSSVRLIGDWTVGKAVGSNTYGDNLDYGWILHPITLKIRNAVDDAAYSQIGFEPDVEIYEYYLNSKLYPLGDTRETLLSTALDEITGKSSFGLRSAPATPDHSSGMIPVASSLERRPNQGLIVPQED